MRDAPGIWTVIGEQSSVRAGFRAAVALTPFRLGEKKINTTAITGSASRSSTQRNLKYGMRPTCKIGGCTKRPQYEYDYDDTVHWYSYDGVHQTHTHTWGGYPRSIARHATKRVPTRNDTSSERSRGDVSNSDIFCAGTVPAVAISTMEKQPGGG